MSDEAAQPPTTPPAGGKKKKRKSSAAPTYVEVTGRQSVWVPIVVSFVGGILVAIPAILSPWVEADVRNQVYEATFQDKNRVLESQKTNLELREQLNAKLSEVDGAKKELEAAKDAIRKKEEEIEAVKASQSQEFRLLRSRMARIDKQERELRAKNAEAAKEHAEQQKRIGPFKNHFCTVYAPEGKDKDGRSCNVGVTSIFAKNTPDSHVVVPARPKCLERPWTEVDEYTEARKDCEKFAGSFLMAKGLTAADVESIHAHGTQLEFEKHFGDSKKSR